MRRYDFALIGHPESWHSATAILSVLRGPGRAALCEEDVREILPWIPPRACSRVTVGSKQGHQVHGLYIDCFIPPDRLDRSFMRESLARVTEAAAYAIRERAGIVSLGGFSSILLEGKTELLPASAETVFTTGNTLTVALIVKGIERAMELAGRDLAASNLLVVGASGDVGSGCARCLAPRVKQLMLCARRVEPLQRLASEFASPRIPVLADTDVKKLSSRADVVICAASLPAPELVFDDLPGGAIVCDAGYPKNLSPSFLPRAGLIVFGGLGQASGGIHLDPDVLNIIYPYPLPNIAHGCLLEGIALAMEGRFEPFSQRRGWITPEKVEEIWEIAQRHGIGLPPLFNREGPVFR